MVRVGGAANERGLISGPPLAVLGGFRARKAYVREDSCRVICFNVPVAVQLQRVAGGDAIVTLLAKEIRVDCRLSLVFSLPANNPGAP